jgi:predicted phosphodiesterase
MKDDSRTFRDHFLSIYQSAAADYASKIPVEESNQPTPNSDRFMQAANEVAELRSKDLSEVPAVEEGVADIPKICASLGLRYLEALVSGDAARAERIREQMTGGTCDRNWVSTLKEYVKYFGVNGTRATIPYRRPSEIGPRVIPIGAGCRIAVFGDWGTGAAPARRILSMIAEQKPDVLLHLGDIYYSGTPNECAANFTGLVRDVFAKSRIPVFTLAGNHDMYSGGIGYYDLVGKLNPGGQAQNASFFCLRTADNAWQILAMDTGLHDYSPLSVTDALTYVEDEEQDWLEQRIREFGGRTILVSHHQMFSAFSQIGKPAEDGASLAYNPNLLGLFRKLQAAGDIAAWFWGHEHNLCIYQPFLGLDRGRCIGHGAIPIFEEEKPYDVLKTLSKAPKLVDSTELEILDGAYEHGFAIVTLGRDGSKTKTEYFADRGRTYSEEF